VRDADSDAQASALGVPDRPASNFAALRGHGPPVRFLGLTTVAHHSTRSADPRAIAIAFETAAYRGEQRVHARMAA
jgi:hypothetical protein